MIHCLSSSIPLIMKIYTFIGSILKIYVKSIYELCIRLVCHIVKSLKKKWDLLYVFPWGEKDYKNFQFGNSNVITKQNGVGLDSCMYNSVKNKMVEKLMLMKTKLLDFWFIVGDAGIVSI